MKPRFLAILTSFTLSAMLVADEPATQYLRKLNSDSFAERNKAQLDLTKWSVENSDAALELFFDVYTSAATPEMKTRVRQLLRERVLFAKYGKAKGFVGIRMENGAKKIGDDLRAVVLVKEVVAGSPAEEFGLKRGDALWRVDQKVFNRNARASDQFIGIVSSKREGDSVIIELLRDGKLIEIKLILAAMPEELERQNNRNFKDAQELNKENYFNTWLQKKVEAE